MSVQRAEIDRQENGNYNYKNIVRIILKKARE
jgi:hypothetical protein